MYRINQQTNSIQKIEETTFKEIGASERNHLQEWIAKNPEAICGEDESLLIIQKEFDGFNDTRERLDLLTLDNNGNLVIIGNKRKAFEVSSNWYCDNIIQFNNNVWSI